MWVGEIPLAESLPARTSPARIVHALTRETAHFVAIRQSRSASRGCPTTGNPCNSYFSVLVKLAHRLLQLLQPKLALESVANRFPRKRWAAGSGKLAARCYYFVALVRPRKADRQPRRHWCPVEFTATSSFRRHAAERSATATRSLNVKHDYLQELNERKPLALVR